MMGAVLGANILPSPFTSSRLLALSGVTHFLLPRDLAVTFKFGPRSPLPAFAPDHLTVALFY